MARITPDYFAIRPIQEDDRTLFEFHLDFPASAKRKSIVYSLDGDQLVHVLFSLRGLQEKYKIPIPPNLRRSGKPKLVFSAKKKNDE